MWLKSEWENYPSCPQKRAYDSDSTPGGVLHLPHTHKHALHSCFVTRDKHKWLKRPGILGIHKPFSAMTRHCSNIKASQNCIQMLLLVAILFRAIGICLQANSGQYALSITLSFFFLPSFLSPLFLSFFTDSLSVCLSGSVCLCVCLKFPEDHDESFGKTNENSQKWAWWTEGVSGIINEAGSVVWVFAWWSLMWAMIQLINMHTVHLILLWWLISVFLGSNST